ncbi:MAG: hypothetical protein WCX85_01820 [Bacilli bacterium]|nr:hypothetical protein [Bacilli bacterium]
MRIILKILMVLVGIAAFFGITASAALWVYGQYGVPLIEEQIEAAEDQVEASLEEEHPGTAITVDIQEVFYKFEGWMPNVAFEVYSLVEAELGGIDIEEKTSYVIVDIMGVISGEEAYATYEESEWATVGENFKAAPTILFNSVEAKKVAVTWIIICAVAFVGSIVVNAVFLRKKRLV